MKQGNYLRFPTRPIVRANMKILPGIGRPFETLLPLDLEDFGLAAEKSAAGIYRDVGAGAGVFRRSGNIRPVPYPVSILAPLLNDMFWAVPFDPELQGGKRPSDIGISLGKPSGTGVVVLQDGQNLSAGAGDQFGFLARSPNRRSDLRSRTEVGRCGEGLDLVSHGRRIILFVNECGVFFDTAVVTRLDRRQISGSQELPAKSIGQTSISANGLDVAARLQYPRTGTQFGRSLRVDTSAGSDAAEQNRPYSLLQPRVPPHSVCRKL